MGDVTAVWAQPGAPGPAKSQMLLTSTRLPGAQSFAEPQAITQPNPLPGFPYAADSPNQSLAETPDGQIAVSYTANAVGQHPGLFNVQEPFVGEQGEVVYQPAGGTFGAPQPLETLGLGGNAVANTGFDPLGDAFIVQRAPPFRFASRSINGAVTAFHRLGRGQLPGGDYVEGPGMIAVRSPGQALLFFDQTEDHSFPTPDGGEQPVEFNSKIRMVALNTDGTVTHPVTVSPEGVFDPAVADNAAGAAAVAWKYGPGSCAYLQYGQFFNYGSIQVLTLGLDAGRDPYPHTVAPAVDRFTVFPARTSGGYERLTVQSSQSGVATVTVRSPRRKPPHRLRFLVQAGTNIFSVPTRALIPVGWPGRYVVTVQVRNAYGRANTVGGCDPRSTQALQLLPALQPPVTKRR